MIPPGWICTRRVGFLFPHPCERTSPVGCADCMNGQLVDPYHQRGDRYLYSDYDDYSGVTDFTEADGETLVKPQDEFEDDMSAS